MAQLVVTYGTPSDPAAFDRHYSEIHVPLARAIPRLRRFETSRGPVLAPDGPSGVYMIATLHFDTLSDIAAAFGNPVVAPATTSSWNVPSTISSLNTSVFTPSSYQSSSWSASASLLGLSSGGWGNYYSATVSRGSTGQTSFFAAVGSAISSVAGWVADPVNVVTGEFYHDVVDIFHFYHHIFWVILNCSYIIIIFYKFTTIFYNIKII